MKKYLLLALLPLLYACSDSPSHRRGVNYDEVFAKDTQGLDIFNGAILSQYRSYLGGE